MRLTRFIAGALVGLLLTGCATVPKYDRRHQPPAPMSEADRKACEEYAAAEVEAEARKAPSMWGKPEDWGMGAAGVIGTFGVALLALPFFTIDHARETGQKRANLSTRRRWISAWRPPSWQTPRDPTIQSWRGHFACSQTARPRSGG